MTVLNPKILKEIKCASDRGGYVVFGNRYMRYSAKVTSFGDGIITVQIIDENEFNKFYRNEDSRYHYSRIKRLGFLEGHYYMFDSDCSSNVKDDAVLEIKGHFELYDYQDSYNPTLVIVPRKFYKTKWKVIRESEY